MSNENCVWQPDEIDLLINLVRDRRELYDQSCAGYSNVNTIEKLWSEIKVYFPTKNEKQLKKKWQILRSEYRTRRGEKLPSGSGSQISKKLVYSLSFLEEHLTERATYSNLKSIYEPGENSAAKAVYVVDENGDLIPEEHVTETNDDDYADRAATPESAHSFRSATASNKGKKRTPVDDVFIEYLQSRKKVENKKRTSNELFVMSLLEDMDRLSSEQQRQFKIEMLYNLQQKLSNNLTM